MAAETEATLALALRVGDPWAIGELDRLAPAGRYR